MKLTTIFFDMHGTLVDGETLHPHYSAALGEVMAALYGGKPAQWEAGNRKAVQHWLTILSQYDFTAPDGVTQLRQANLRLMRFNFEYAGVPCPADADEDWLAEGVAYEITRRCHVSFPDVRPAIRTLAAQGFSLGVASTVFTSHTRGLIEGMGLADCFQHFIGPDVTDLVFKDAEWFRRGFGACGVRAEESLVVDDSTDVVLAAHAVGAQAVLLNRQGLTPPDHSSSDCEIHDLRELLPPDFE